MCGNLIKFLSSLSLNFSFLEWNKQASHSCFLLSSLCYWYCDLHGWHASTKVACRGSHVLVAMRTHTWTVYQKSSHCYTKVLKWLKFCSSRFNICGQYWESSAWLGFSMWVLLVQSHDLCYVQIMQVTLYELSSVKYLTHQLFRKQQLTSFWWALPGNLEEKYSVLGYCTRLMQDLVQCGRSWSVAKLENSELRWGKA